MGKKTMGTKSFGASPLIEAIRANNLLRVVSALDDGADVEENDIHGYPGLPLRTACFFGSVPIIRELLTRGADVNAPTADGPGAPLRAALRAGHSEIVALLLSRDAQIPYGLNIPSSIFERAKALGSGNAEILDVPMLEFDRVTPPARPAPVRPAPAPATAPAQASKAEQNATLLDFSTIIPDETIQEVDLRGYGVDTRVMTLDIERTFEAWDKTEGADKKTPSGGGNS